jgi:hypothetical protein
MVLVPRLVRLSEGVGVPERTVGTPVIVGKC